MILTLGNDDFDPPDALLAMVDALHEGSRPRVGLNLRLLSFLSSSAFGLLIRLNKRLQAKGGELVLIQPSEFVASTLLTLGLDGYFTILGSNDAALGHFHGTNETDVERLRLEKRIVQDAVVLTFKGELDTYNLERHAREIDALIESGHTKLGYDLTDLTFVNSAALGYLIRATKLARDRGGDVVLIRPSPFAWTTIRTLGLESLFLVFGSVEGATAYLDHGDEEGVIDPRAELRDEVDEPTGSRSIVFWNEAEDRIIGVGRIVEFDERGVTFRWRIPDAADAFFPRLVEGSQLGIKFRQPLAKEAHLFTARARIAAVETSLMDIDIEEATLRLEYLDMDEADREILVRTLAALDALRG
jgi:anti-sigma B factor antagonist